MIKKCGCADIIVPTINNTDYCATYEKIICLKDFARAFRLTDINSFCENSCPQECNTIEYGLSVTTSGFPTLNYLKLLQSDLDFAYPMFPLNVSDSELAEFANKAFLKLVINYENLYFISLDVSATMDAQALFGFLGGQLGMLYSLT